MKPCAQCATEFRCKPSNYTKKRYCSMACMAKAYSLSMVGPGNPNFRNDASRKLCLSCGSEYRSYQPTRKYCSTRCSVAANRETLRASALKGASVHKDNAAYRRAAFPEFAKKVKVYIPTGGKRGPKSKPRAPTHICVQCHVPFHAYEKRRLFCSYPCSIKNGTAFRAGESSRIARMRYGAKKDANHNSIQDALRSRGCCVYDVSSVGGGVPDCIVWANGLWHLVEIKNPNTPYGKRGLNEVQKGWIGRWQGGPVYIIRTLEDVENFVAGNVTLLDRQLSAAGVDMAEKLRPV